jgi:spermidine/putrescine transport system substrate-binding protein
MLDGPSDVLGIGLIRAGFSFNSGDPEELRKAQKLAIEQKPLVRAYLNAEVRDQLVAGDVWAAQVWSVTAAQAIAAAPNKLNYLLPAEGFPRYADTVAILRESPRAEAAHRFLNYLLRGDVAAEIVRVTRTSTANARAYALLPEATKQSSVLYPPSSELARGEWFTPQSAASQRLRDRLWTEIKSA